MDKMTRQEQTSHRWLFDSHRNSRRSTWLQATLAELEENTEAMLKLIQGDADSFTQRAEMYYKKRPQLISMVEEFYRAHRSLAERYDQARVRTRFLGSPCSTKCHSENSTSVIDDMTYEYDSLSETCELEYSASEVDDHEDESQVDKRTKAESSIGTINDEVRKLKEEIERLQEENRIQMNQLKQKDEEKREVIRQLSVPVDFHKDEILKLRKCLARESADNSIRFFELNKLKGTFFRKLFSKSSKSRAIIVPLKDVC